MEIKIQLADNVYKALMSGGNRIQGSIGLISPTEGNFNAHRRADRKEADVVPCEVIEVESQAASDFVYSNS